ncbi:MAG: squalene/phytoene synthase family protein [Pseudomonadota bacterium]
MAETGLSPAADLVRRLDPPLFLAALFAREPARERLMVLSAFDIELSRAVAKARETTEAPMLARMRLQFWRDRLAAAEMGDAPGLEVAAHEVAGPLHDLLTGHLAGSIAEAEALIEAREAELDAPFDAGTWAHWVETRFGAWYRLALAALDLGPSSNAALAASSAGTIAAAGFVLRHAMPLAAEGAVLLPGLGQGEAALILRGERSGQVDEAVTALLAEGRAARRTLSSFRSVLGRRAAPAFLPLLRAERTLRRAAGGADLAALADGADSRALSAAYLWRATTGRW